MPAGALGALKGMLTSIDDSTVNQSIRHGASLKSVKVADPDIDEDTY